MIRIARRTNARNTLQLVVGRANKKKHSYLVRGQPPTVTAWKRTPSIHSQIKRMVQGVPIVDDCIVNLNPATGDVISRVPCTTAEQINAMVEKANQVQPSWAAHKAADRVALLRAGLEKLAQQSDALVDMIVQEVGKPIEQAKEEVQGATNKDEFLNVLLQALLPKKYGTSIVVREPLGVVTVMSPWNFPADEVLLLLLPSLGSGNTAIVKPSEVAPETGALVVNTLASLLPEGVLQLAQGDGAVGKLLVSHPSIHMVAMTGSSATGKKILESAAPSLKRCVLELGGKDPMIVFDDADLDRAAKDAVEFSLYNTGQVCCSVERIYVADSVYDEFQERVAQVAASYKVGNGTELDVKVGPMVSAMQRDHVKAHIDDALTKGAKLLYQSDVPSGNESVGNYCPVTVLGDVRDGMRIYREETFGPVVSLTPFDGTEKEAIRLANDTEYGLASCVYTQDKVKGTRVAGAIQSGQVGINCYALANMNIACPWVGHKSSGYGYHSGEDGFHQFSIPKTLVYLPED